MTLILLFTGGGFFLTTTLAANLSLSSGGVTEFGQGFSQTVTCSGSTSLLITPKSTFTNFANGTGNQYLSSVRVSNIPSNCNGADLTLSFYDNSSANPLPLFNSTATRAIVSNTAGTFRVGIDSYGTKVTSGAGEFTVTFSVPVSLSSSVSKVTIQSGPRRTSSCSNGGTCYVGDTGPGGGTVYYVAATPFSCGSDLTSSCRYLEVSPLNTIANEGYGKLWGANRDVPSIVGRTTASLSAAELGAGLRNTLAIITTMNEAPAQTDYAALLTQNYRGGGKSDWYLPTLSELNLMCQWNRGVNLDPTTTCAGGTWDDTLNGGGKYWSSTEYDTTRAHALNFSNLVYVPDNTKNYSPNNTLVRPIRAF